MFRAPKKTDWILAQEKRREGYTFFPLPFHFLLGSPLSPPLSSYYLNCLECYFKLTFNFNWCFLVSSVYPPLEEATEVAGESDGLSSKSFLGVEETRNALNRRENA